MILVNFLYSSRQYYFIFNYIIMITTQAQVIDYKVGMQPDIVRPTYNGKVIVTFLPEDDTSILHQAQDHEITDEIRELSKTALQKDKSRFTSL
jgi:hypothetical protein